MAEADADEVERCRAIASAWAPTLRALANEERLLIVLWLAGGSRSVRELQDVTGLAQSVVSYHLALLRDADLVRAHPEGRSNRYRLQSPALDEVATILGTLAPHRNDPRGDQPEASAPTSASTSTRPRARAATPTPTRLPDDDVGRS